MIKFSTKFFRKKKSASNMISKDEADNIFVMEFYCICLKNPTLDFKTLMELTEKAVHDKYDFTVK